MRKFQTFQLSKFGFVSIFVCLCVLMAGTAFGADRLVIKNDAGTTTFTVQDTGRTLATEQFRTQSAFPGFWLDETGDGMQGLYFVLDNGTFQLQRRAQNFGQNNLGSPMRFKITAPADTFMWDADGDIGLGGVGFNSIVHPIQHGNGAYLSSGGVWTDASSRELKQDIRELNSQEAMDTFMKLQPVTFSYKRAPEDQHVGFIAEDVPDLVASSDRKGLSAMDIVATLTKVVQQQQKTIDELTKKMNALETK